MNQALPTQPLRDEHRELLPHIEELRALGDAADGSGWAPLLDASVDFLKNHLLVHAQAEEKVLYPAVARLFGASRATATMSRDHVEVERLVAELEALRNRVDGRALEAEEARELRRLAYGLHTLIGVHFAKEEEVYLPLIDERLNLDAARSLFADMEQAAAAARAGR